MHYFFDLDHTLINSSHRQNTTPDGSLDLQHWIENNTPEKIMQDSLTPLGRAFQRGSLTDNRGKIVIACTARVIGNADIEFLQFHGLHFQKILSRPLGCKDSDVALKETLLRRYALEHGISFARMMRYASFWDDNQSILDHFAQYGTRMIDPKPFNRSHG